MDGYELNMLCLHLLTPRKPVAPFRAHFLGSSLLPLLRPCLTLADCTLRYAAFLPTALLRPHLTTFPSLWYDPALRWRLAGVSCCNNLRMLKT